MPFSTTLPINQVFMSSTYWFRISAMKLDVFFDWRSFSLDSLFSSVIEITSSVCNIHDPLEYTPLSHHFFSLLKIIPITTIITTNVFTRSTGPSLHKIRLFDVDNFITSYMYDSALKIIPNGRASLTVLVFLPIYIPPIG